jgi:predicted regulator of amino acid metabolism with ACT domain
MLFIYQAFVIQDDLKIFGSLEILFSRIFKSISLMKRTVVNVLAIISRLYTLNGVFKELFILYVYELF